MIDKSDILFVTQKKITRQLPIYISERKKNTQYMDIYIKKNIPDKISLRISVVASHKLDTDFLFRQHMSSNMVSIHSMVPNHPHRFLSKNTRKKTCETI